MAMLFALLILVGVLLWIQLPFARLSYEGTVTEYRLRPHRRIALFVYTAHFVYGVLLVLVGVSSMALEHNHSVTIALLNASFGISFLMGMIVFLRWGRFIERVDWVLYYCITAATWLLILALSIVLKVSQVEDLRRFDTSHYTGSTGRSFTITGGTHGTNLSSHQSPSR